MSDSFSSSGQKLLSASIRWRSLWLVAAILAAVAAIPVASRLEFDQRIESLYADDDPVLNNFLQSKRWFGGDEFVLCAYEDPDLFESDGLQVSTASRSRLDQLEQQLNAIPGVNAESTQQLGRSLEFKYRRETVRRLLTGILVGEDGVTTNLVLRLVPEDQTDEPRAETIRKIRAVAAAQDFPVYILGEPVQIHDMFRYVEEDGGVLFRYSVLLLSLVLFAFFRSFRWVAIAVLVVLITITWTEAALVLSGVRLSMVSSMLNSLVTIVGVATVTHLTVRFQDKLRLLPPIPALEETFRELLPAIFWTCGTTAAGFAALLSSSITPVRSFGLMMALSMLVVLLVVVLVVPGAVLIGRRGPGRSTSDEGPPADNAQSRIGITGDSRLAPLLGQVNRLVDRHPAALSLVTGVIVLFAAAGFTRLEVETDFSKNFRENSPIARSLRFFEQQLGGAGTWEVNFPAPQTLDEPYLERVAALTAELRKLEGRGAGKLRKVVSLTDGLEIVPRKLIFELPLATRLGLLRRFQGEFVSSLHNPEAGRMRIVLRAEEQQPADQKNQLIADVQQRARAEFPDAEIQPVATGIFVLLAFLIDSLLSDQLTSFLLAALGVVTMMTVAFRSLRIGLISLVPNLFPIVLVVGAMGWLDLPINIATAMIASVSMGLTVDNSIHFLSSFERSRRGGLTVREALAEAHQTVGKALIFANLALIAGFSVLTLSHFIPLVYFGILVSVAMFGGLVGNLLLMPLLLQWSQGRGEPAGVPQTAESA